MPTPRRPECDLIATALLRRNETAPVAATRIGMSKSRYRQVLNGYVSDGPGKTKEVVAPAKTLARIAFDLGITPGDLRGANREDAASLVEAMSSHAPELDSAASLLDEVGRARRKLAALLEEFDDLYRRIDGK